MSGEVRVADARLLTPAVCTRTHARPNSISISPAQAATLCLTFNPPRHCRLAPSLNYASEYITVSFKQVMTYRPPYDPNRPSISVLFCC